MVNVCLVCDRGDTEIMFTTCPHCLKTVCTDCLGETIDSCLGLMQSVLNAKALSWKWRREEWE